MAAKPPVPPPAYFLSLSLENVRSFGTKQTISFARPDGRPAQWTIILGDNGVGKTTVLKAMAGMMPITSAEYSKQNRFPFFVEVNYGSDYLPLNAIPHIEIGWNPFRGDGKDFAVFESEVVSNGSLLDEKENNPLCTLQYYISIKRSMYGKIGDLPKGLIIYGYGAGRVTGNSTLSKAPKDFDSCASLFDDRANLLNPEEWFLQMEYSSLKQDKQAAEALEQVRQVLLQVLPDVTDLRISSKGHQQFLELQTPYGWVRLRDMSLGYQTLVVWLTDFTSKLFIRYPNSKNPLEEPAIVLIDEIDLHLHPSWQRKLIRFLSDIFKNTQFIATAHSPLVVQAAGDKDANVVLLKREGDQTIVYQGADLPDVRHWRVEQILSSELFDETPPLSPQTEADLTRRNQLRLKKRPPAREKAELAELDAAVAAQPLGNTRAEQQADNLLSRLARHLNPDER